MEGPILKHIKDEHDIGYILQHMEAIEKFYPCYSNLIEPQHHSSELENEQIESKMKKERID